MVYTGATNIQFRILSGMINPESTQETEQFSIRTTDQYDYVIDTVTSLTITAVANSVTNVTITSFSDDGSLCVTSSPCTYNLTINMTYHYPILVNSKMLI